MRGTSQGVRPPLALGIAPLDARLGGGLQAGCIHEISGPTGDAAAAGFAATLLGLFSGRGPVAWIAARRARLHAPGLAALGLDPRRLLLVEAPRAAERAWAFEEALRSGIPAAVLAEIEDPGFVGSRRLQLAAGSGTTGLLLAQGRTPASPSAARSRWRVASARSAPRIAGVAGATESEDRALALAIGPGAPRWRVELRRGPDATSGAWTIECGSQGLRLAEAAPQDATDFAGKTGDADRGRRQASRAAAAQADPLPLVPVPAARQARAR
ncbi:MAG: ImuA family protein [Alphaproteobacteria bacterium]